MLTDERIDRAIEIETGFRPSEAMRSLCRAIEAEVWAKSIGCTRSHPHENMSAECEAKTVEARRVFMQAQEPVAWVTVENGKCVVTRSADFSHVSDGQYRLCAHALDAAPQPPALSAAIDSLIIAAHKGDAA